MTVTLPPSSTLKPLSFGEHVQEKIPRWEKIVHVVRIIALTLLVCAAAAAAFALIGTGVGGIVAGTVGSAAIIGFGAAGGAGAGFLGGLITLGALFGAKKYKQPPCTSTLGLDAETHGATPIGSYSKNNTAMVCSTPTEVKEFKLEFLRKAKRSLEISGNYVGGEAFLQGIDNIRTAMTENPQLQVRLIACTELMEKNDMEAMRQLKKEFPNRFHYLCCGFKLKSYPLPQTVEEHVKVIIVDEKYYIQGGSPLRDAAFRDLDKPLPKGKGMGDYIMQKCSDMDVIGSGPVAKTLRLEYYKLWAKWAMVMGKAKTLESHYFPLSATDVRAEIEMVDQNPRLKKEVDLKVLVSGPEHARKQNNAIRREYVRMINGAKKTIRIANFFFNPHSDIMNALCAAVKRGVKVTYITNRMGKNSNSCNWLFVPNMRLSYEKFLRGGQKGKSRKERRQIAALSTAEIFEYGTKTRTKVLLHKKAMSVDGEEAIVGSYNLGKCSEHHDEMILSIRDRHVVKQIDDEFATDISFSDPVTYDQARKYSRNIIGKLFRFFVAPFTG